MCAAAARLIMDEDQVCGSKAVEGEGSVPAATGDTHQLQLLTGVEHHPV